ncbi:hypothetical protein CYY_002224 [Polysphondylium violaceum]|uniref:U1 small nuclear ribonucleoprotein C n=1 Tax=Polysphondylium violaceum TaxID=133409 RepID=A0A8J4V9U6_9MYCE|nr:hypothetical protein CYY_002224 [Polysphondylium violaceum]
MAKYYCDYCDKFLTHDSPSVRKSHTSGKLHKLAVQRYYQQFEDEFTQSLIDERLKELAKQKMSGSMPMGGPFAPYPNAGMGGHPGMPPQGPFNPINLPPNIPNIPPYAGAPPPYGMPPQPQPQQQQGLINPNMYQQGPPGHSPPQSHNNYNNKPQGMSQPQIPGMPQPSIPGI